MVAGLWDDCGDGVGTCWSGPAECASPPPAPPSPPPPVAAGSGAGCWFAGFDYYQPGCGYADMVAIYDNRSDADSAGWFTGTRGWDAGLDTAAECQALCASTAGCAYFSFEVQAGSPEARCYLKAAYDDAACSYSARLPPRRCFARALLCSFAPARGV